MKITTEQLYSRLTALQLLFSYKLRKKIDTNHIAILSKKEFDSIQFRPRLSQFVLPIYADLASSISSNRITLHSVDLYYLGEYVKNTYFPSINDISTEAKFREAYNVFYSANAINAQIQNIIQLSKTNNSTFAKFTKTNKSVFEIDSTTQTNLLYESMISGEINVYVFSYFYKQGMFTIDFSKIQNIQVYRNLKIAEYVGNFKLNEILI